MANQSPSRLAETVRELFSMELYKRSQGQFIRTLTVVGVGGFLLWGLKSLSSQLVAMNKPVTVAYGVPAILAAVAAWGLFRIYNWPRFADFLIATQAEMNKVSWSSKAELKQATAVVLITLFLLAGFLFFVDIAWSWVLREIGILLPKGGETLEQVPGDETSLLEMWDYLKNIC